MHIVALVIMNAPALVVSLCGLMGLLISSERIEESYWKGQLIYVTSA